MNDELTGTEFGGSLDNLRLVARVHMPKMAQDYQDMGGKLSETVGFADGFRRSEYFGPQKFEPIWNQLRDLMWTASDGCGDVFASAAEALSKALEDFSAQDQAAAAEMDLLRQSTEGGQQLDDEWKSPYNPARFPNAPGWNHFPDNRSGPGGQ